ncbi:hypothetical protein Tco_0892823 [Tanacetum coccineum]|uniref:Uncharacterized protein n=1 Tax=Tanacetum coccineum TaxID=301880 RepID=A0ABQ5C792_9ASTR
MVDAYLGTRLRDSIQKDLRSYTVEFKKEAQAEKERYIDLIEKSVKDIINDEVKTQLPQILPKAVSDFATPVIKSTVIESLEDAVLAKSSSQPQSTYKATTSLTELELKKILIDKMEKIQSNLIADEHKELYKALDKDEDPPAGSDHGMKRQKTSKDAEFTKGQDMDNTDDQQNVEAASKYDGFKKPKRPSTPDSDWNVVKSFDFRPPQTWISKIAQAEKPPISFDKLMNTPIDFLTYVMNHLNIDNLIKDHLVGPVFNILKGTCRSCVELEYNIKECYKAVLKDNESMDLQASWCPTDVLIHEKNKAVTKVKEGDFPRLHLHGIEDMMLLLVPKKLSDLERDVIFDLGVALRMFTRCIVILKRVEDLQLGIKRYQKKLNITKPETFRSNISNIIPYTAYNNPQGIIYEYKYKRNRLMRMDELYKFSDKMLTSVRSILHDFASNLRMDYLLEEKMEYFSTERGLATDRLIDKQL